MQYVIHYDIAAIVVFTFIIMAFYGRKAIPTKANRAFSAFMLAGISAAVLDLLSCFTIEYSRAVPVWFNYILNILVFVSTNVMYVTYFRYLVIMTENVSSKFWKAVGWMVLGIYCVNVLLELTTPWTHLVFYFDGTKYSHGAFYAAHFISGGVVLVFCIILTFMTRRVLTLTQHIIMLVGTGLFILAVAVQFFFPKYLLMSFATSFYCLGLYQSLQNPADYLDQKLKIYNLEAFAVWLDQKISENKKFSLLVFRLEGLNFVDQFMGMENSRELQQAVVKECRNYEKKLPFFYLGKKRFAFLFPDENEEAVTELAETLRWRFLSTFPVKGVKVNLTAKFCGVKYSELGCTKDELLNAVDYTLSGKEAEMRESLPWVTKDGNDAYLRENMITHILKRALVNREFEVYYQPIYSVKKGTFTSAEALIRLRDPEIGFIPPDEFIPIAERHGLILEIGDFVFRKVCEFISSDEITKRGIEYIEVNLSMVQCMQKNLSEEFAAIMDSYHVPKEMVDFEITETFSASDNDVLVDNMNQLIEMGSTFAADDFGTGFASTSYLMDYPFKIVKLDKTFIWKAMEDEKAMQILKHTAAMIKSLNLSIVAEGVETVEQATALANLGVDFLQGFYFSKPLERENFLSFLDCYGKAFQTIH